MPQFTQLAIQIVADAKIRQPYDDGKFNKLPGYGKPLDVVPNRNTPLWQNKALKREIIRTRKLQNENEN